MNNEELKKNIANDYFLLEYYILESKAYDKITKENLIKQIHINYKEIKKRI